VLSFKKITIEDKEAITAYTYPSSFHNCDYAFANMCSWHFLYDSEFAISDDFLFIRFYVEEKGHRRLAYMFPAGYGELKQAIDILEKDAEYMGRLLLIFGITPNIRDNMEALFPGHFTYMKERDYFDYIYLREELSILKGRKFQSKRNHINKFKSKYDYTYLPINKDIIAQCMEVEAIWYKANLNEDDKTDITHERQSMIFALEHFDKLKLMGGAIVVDGKIIAFTYGSQINNITFGIHVEKADVSYEGIFSVINQEFASRIPLQYIYINREEDLGLPGLRKSKLSYNPVMLLEKNAAVKRR